LVGGGRGGPYTPSGVEGGGGGGAIQIASLASISISSTVEVNGGGGDSNLSDQTLPSAGGGAGGTVVLESPQVALSDGIAANGGAGGACGYRGQDGSAGMAPARPTMACDGLDPVSHNTFHVAGGSGGTGTSMAGDAQGGFTMYGGGGGAVGRVVVRTGDGVFAPSGSGYVSAKLTVASLGIH
jgi:hypothetical protein